MPFGAHATPMPDGADLSLPAIATLISIDQPETLTDHLNAFLAAHT